jgi:hypothetical protein
MTKVDKIGYRFPATRRRRFGKSVGLIEFLERSDMLVAQTNGNSATGVRPRRRTFRRAY